jgi:hypothetical protein
VGGGNTITVEPPTTYEFASRFDPRTGSVAYDGQVVRQILIEEFVGRLDGLTAAIDGGDRAPGEGEVAAELAFYLDFEAALGGDLEHSIATSPASLQATLNDVSTGKDLTGKIAGNDPVGQHRDWSSEFVGWGPVGSVTPEQLVRSWLDEVDARAVARSLGEPARRPDGSPVASVFVTEDGRDLQQLIEKFLRMAIAFSQGADDYLDDDTSNKGLLSPNVQDGTKPYTVLEHQWDEGFGYFGAARDYLSYSDDEIAGKSGRPDRARGYHDSNGDGLIDLLSEYNFGHSRNAAKRDRAAVVPTDFTRDAMNAFLRGRAIIAMAGEELTDAELAALQSERDAAVLAWESAIAATVVHYINATLQDMRRVGTPDYDFEDHAKHWSELKGFALGLQFNPRSPLDDAAFAEFHARVGTRPVLETDGAAALEAYADELLGARALLGDAYGFDPANLGRDDGTEGW